MIIDEKTGIFTITGKNEFMNGENVSITPDLNIQDIAEIFPFHQVTIGPKTVARNITSLVMNNQIIIDYSESGYVENVEIRNHYKPSHLGSLLLRGFDLFRIVSSRLPDFEFIESEGAYIDKKFPFISLYRHDGDYSQLIDAVNIDYNSIK